MLIARTILCLTGASGGLKLLMGNFKGNAEIYKSHIRNIETQQVPAGWFVAQQERIYFGYPPVADGDG